MVTKPVEAVVWHGAIDTNHQVAIKQHLREGRAQELVHFMKSLSAEV